MVKGTRMQRQVQRERDIHLELEHRHVLKMFGCFVDDGKIVVVLEYAPGGTVFQELRKEVRFTDVKAATYMLQLSDALNYLHDKGIIHRDIKPENLLIGFRGEIKVADFGLAVKPGFRSRLTGNKTICGTPDYLAPEMVKLMTSPKQGYDKKVDNWCLGVLCFEFLVGKPPFKGENQIDTFRKISSGVVSFPDDIYVAEDAQDLIRGLLQTDPRHRLKLRKIKKHAWILRNTGSNQVDLSGEYLPMFQKYSGLLPALKKRYDEAANSAMNRN